MLPIVFYCCLIVSGVSQLWLFFSPMQAAEVRGRPKRSPTRNSESWSREVDAQTKKPDRALLSAKKNKPNAQMKSEKSLI